MEFSIGKQAFKSGAEALNSELAKVDYGAIRKYFDVTDRYIMQKLLLILVPFYYNEDSVGSQLYRADLYIPAMSLITLVLHKGMLLGLANQFKPEILGITLTRMLLIHFGISLFYKGITHFMDATVNFKDILSYTGYKFFVILIIKAVKEYFIGKILFFYLIVAYFFFLSRCLKGSLLSSNSPRGHLYLLFGIVGIDLVITFLLSR